MVNETSGQVAGAPTAGRRISAHAVCTAIRDDIVDGAFQPGARLTEELLARRYGVSRVPVREALRTLESEGFVTTRRHAGACVAEPTEQEASDLLDIRALLEPLGAARAAQRRTEAHLKVLRGLVRLGQQRAERGQLSDLRSLGDWFHETLAQASGSPSLASLLTQLRRKIAWVYAAEPTRVPADAAMMRAGATAGADAITRMGVIAPGSGAAGPAAGQGQASGGPSVSAAQATASWEEHGAIVDAVARGDAERARSLAAAHAERTAALHRLRRPTVVRSTKPVVNTMRGRI